MLGIADTCREAELPAAPTWPHWVTKAPHTCFRMNFEGPNRHFYVARLDGVPTLALHWL